MSTPPPVGPPPSAGRSRSGVGTGLLLGCGGGCLLVVLAVAALVFVVGRAVKQQTEKVEAQIARHGELNEKVAALEEAHPPAVPEDLATAEVSDDIVSRWLVAWNAVEPALVENAEAQRRLEEMIESAEAGEMTSLSDLWSMVKEGAGAMAAGIGGDMAVREALAEGLAAAEMGTTEFRRLLAIVDWRFLGRDNAIGLGLEENERWEYEWSRDHVENLKTLLGDSETGVDQLREWVLDDVPSGATDVEVRELARKELEESQAKLEAMQANAAEQRTLTEGTRAVLEARRAELEARAAPGLGPLLGGMGMMGFSEHGGEHGGEHGAEHRDEHSDEEAEAPASEGETPTD